LLLVVLARPVAAQEATLPVDLQMVLFSQVMRFDRNFADREDEVVLAVLYQSGFRESVETRSQVFEAFGGEGAFAGRPLRIIGIDVGDNDTKRSLLRMLPRGINLLYLAPVRSFDVSSVAEAANELGIPTITGVPDYVDQGLAIGVRREQGRPRILVNLESALATGSDLSSELLKLARIVTS
jgi:hypothetical protein